MMTAEAKIDEVNPKTVSFGTLKYLQTSPEAVMGLTTIGQLLPVPYKDSAAGSNPREFQGMKSVTNKKILRSLLANPDKFWALHSGVSITVISGEVRADFLDYEDACLTNGLQTVTIARILAMVKAYQVENQRPEIHTKINKSMSERWLQCMHDTFSSDVVDQLEGIKVEHVNSVLNWLHSADHSQLRKKFNLLSLGDLLDVRVSIKAVLLDPLVTSDGRSENRAVDLENLGYEIAEANNETQKVEAGDLFGSHHEKWLREELFKRIEPPVIVEYKRFAEDRSNTEQKIVHVLDLLRALIPTTLVIDSDADDPALFVARYANRREPIYNWFEKKIIRPHQHHRTEVIGLVNIMCHLLPDMVEMMFLVQKQWEKQRREISFENVNEWVSLKTASATMKGQIFEDEKWSRPRPDADSVLKKYLGFSFANVFTIFVFATRKAIKIDEDLSVVYELDVPIVMEVVQNIYKHLSKGRLQSAALGSTSEIFRNAELYSNAADTFGLIARMKEIDLPNSVERYQIMV